MSESIELCALRDGFWDLIASYPSSQEQIAIKEAANIQSGYLAVAVLSVEKMRVTYYASLRNVPQPDYYEIRKSVRADRPTMRQKTMPQAMGTPRPSEKPDNHAPPANNTPTKSATPKEKHAPEHSFLERLLDAIMYLLTGSHFYPDMEEKSPTDTHTAPASKAAHTAPSTDNEGAAEQNTTKDLQSLLENHLKQEEEAQKKAQISKEVEEKIAKEDAESTPAISLKADERKAQKKNPFLKDDVQAEQHETTANDATDNPSKAPVLKHENAALPKIGGGHLNVPHSHNTQENAPNFLQQLTDADDDYEKAKAHIQKKLLDAVERAKQIAWLPEQNMMRGTLQLASILLLCGIGRKICSDTGIPGGIGNTCIARALEELDLSEKQSYICTLHIDRILSEPNNKLMYLIGRAYGANILHDTESRIDLLSIFNAWEANTLETFFEIDESGNAGKLSKLPYLKAISIMLTDIVGFTKQSNENGEKWVKDVVYAHTRMTKTVAGRHKGEYLQSTGDGSLMIFTTPEAAMHAAVELEIMQQNFCRRVKARAFDVRIAISHGIPIKTQSGLHGPPIEELTVIDRAMKNGTIAVTKAIADGAKPHGFKFSLISEEKFPIYEFSAYTGSHNINTEDDETLPDMETAPLATQEGQQPHDN